MKKTYLLVILIFLLRFIYAEILTKSERQVIFSTLKKAGLKQNDLNFLKDWSGDTKFKVPVITDIINHPLQFPIFVDSLGKAISLSDEYLLDFCAENIFGYGRTNEGEIDSQKWEEMQIESEKEIFEFVETIFAETDKFYTAIFDSLSSEEMDKLTYFAEEYPEGEIEDSEEIYEIIKKIDFDSLWKAAHFFQFGYDILVQKLEKIQISNKKAYIRETGFGKFCIGSSSDDNYIDNYAFIWDPDGNDSYRFPIKANYEHPFYWIIDSKGDDVYQNDDIGGVFSVLCGLGIDSDFTGDDHYFGSDLSFSSFFGFQKHYDGEGDDTYRTGLFSLAAATFGISIFEDKAGNELYYSTEYAQGFGGTLGMGVLIDRDGNDTYRVGGKYLHKPLAPFDYRSMGQGFGFGMRPDFGGGIGVLYDENGNDHYDGGVFAQGVGYWYALGILFDKKGNDFYDAVYYPQGSGIHLAGGMLFDGDGEDHYYSKHGPGQGAGHDYAVGFLLDKGGNDCYSIEGGNGLGLTNSVGIFYDVSGNDQYQRKYKKDYGYANKARNSGGIGLFIDTGGDDLYALDKTGNDSLWINGTYGIGFDTLKVIYKQPVTELAEENTTKIDTTASVNEIFKIASGWAVGSDAQKVKRAANLLLERDKESCEYIAGEELGTKSGLTYRAIKNFAKRSQFFKSYLHKSLVHDDSLYVKNAISLLGELADSTAVESFENFLGKRKYVNSVLSALGSIKTERSVLILTNYRFVGSEKTRVIVARGLVKINSPLSKTKLFEMENDESFLIRTMIKLEKDKEDKVQ